MILYYSPGACSLAPHIVANEANLELKLIKVDLAKKITMDGDDYSSINKKGYVPALQLPSKEILTEGAAIMQYLADLVPTAHLLAEVGNLSRYRTLEWLNYTATELHKPWGILYGSSYNDEAKTVTKTRILKRINYLEVQLATQPYLVGETFSIADAYLFTILRWSKHAHFELPQYLKDYVERIQSRPAVQRALKEEGTH